MNQETLLALLQGAGFAAFLYAFYLVITTIVDEIKFQLWKRKQKQQEEVKQFAEAFEQIVKVFVDDYQSRKSSTKKLAKANKRR